MAESFRLRVITPAGSFYDGEVSMVEFTTTQGDIGVYAGHIPMTAVIAPGAMTIHEEGGNKLAALISGFVEILQDKVTIMAETCEWPDDIDEARAREAKERAERRLKENSPESDIMRAELALRRALVRLNVKNR